jgi:hypothetical protein
MSFAKLGWKYQPIPFVVSSKSDSTIEEGGEILSRAKEDL